MKAVAKADRRHRHAVFRRQLRDAAAFRAGEAHLDAAAHQPPRLHEKLQFLPAHVGRAFTEKYPLHYSHRVSAVRSRSSPEKRSSSGRVSAPLRAVARQRGRRAP